MRINDTRYVHPTIRGHFGVKPKQRSAPTKHRSPSIALVVIIFSVIFLRGIFQFSTNNGVGVRFFYSRNKRFDIRAVHTIARTCGDHCAQGQGSSLTLPLFEPSGGRERRRKKKELRNDPS